MIKIYKLTSGHRAIGDGKHHPVADYLYCVSLFGIIIHSVTLYDIHRDSVNLIFKNRKIINKAQNKSNKPHSL
jgi:fumarate reductase subunit C